MKPGALKLTAIGVFGLILCLCGVTIVIASSWILLQEPPLSAEVSWTTLPDETAWQTPATTATSQPTAGSPSATQADFATPTLVPKEGLAQTSQSQDMLTVFTNTVIPMSDPIEMVQKLNGGLHIPTQLEFQVRHYAVGDQETFWALNSDDNQSKQVQATLQYVTDRAYFWVEDGVRFNSDHMKSLLDVFDSKIYPTNHRFFGSEWSPGVDADPRVFILYASDLGSRVAGHFYPYDEYLPLVHPNSNAREMFYLNAARLGLAEPFAYSVLAHEHQHMIHWNLDRNEETWLNEGFANLAAHVNGYDIGGADFSYVMDPDVQLNYWSAESENRLPHYGAAFLFLAYFLERFGEQATQQLVANQANGMSSVDAVLQEIQAKDPRTGAPVAADEFFADWAVATFLQDEQASDGRYVTSNYPDAPTADPAEYVDQCPVGSQQRDVSQYGIDFIRIDCQGDYSIKFAGVTHVNALPENPHSGEFAFYSNHGDESAMSLTRQFDFSDQAGPLTFEYWTWFDLEADYDYVYLMASTDGENWRILTTPSGTAEDPSGNNHGWGYTGLSGSDSTTKRGASWIREQVDISEFAGQQVWLRFEYITDAAIYAEGFLVDDITIPQVGYAEDFEQDEGGWLAEGFVRLVNLLPQSFRLSLILVGDETRVETIELDPANQATIPFSLDAQTEYAVLVVSGTTRFTRQKALYSFAIQN